jgi:hypothetical protein
MDQDLSKFLTFISLSGEEDRLKKKIKELFYAFGNPYIAICFKCDKLYPCLFIQHNPFDEEVENTVLGLLVIVDRETQLNKNIEALFKNSTVIRTYGRKTVFYIPFKYTLATLKKVCGEKVDKIADVYPIKIEEAEIFIDE